MNRRLLRIANNAGLPGKESRPPDTFTSPVCPPMLARDPEFPP